MSWSLSFQFRDSVGWFSWEQFLYQTKFTLVVSLQSQYRVTFCPGLTVSSTTGLESTSWQDTTAPERKILSISIKIKCATWRNRWWYINVILKHQIAINPYTGHHIQLIYYCNWNFNINILPKMTGRKTYVQLIMMICGGVKTFDTFIAPIWLKAEGLKMTCDWLALWKMLQLFLYVYQARTEVIWPEFHYMSILD